MYTVGGKVLLVEIVHLHATSKTQSIHTQILVNSYTENNRVNTTQ